jgi:LysM repeat protein
VAAAFTQIAVSTQTVIATSTELPNTGIDGGGPGGTGFTILGNHTVRANEYLYCLGRAYGVTPEAIARVNFLSLNATLFVGQTLVIPDAPWEDIPAGRVCTPQFESPYAPIRSFSETSFADPLHISFHGKYPDLEQSHPVGVLYRKFSAITPEPADEIRTVKVTLPTSMRLGESSLITLELNVETGQPTVSVTSSPNVSPDVSTNTPPDQKIDLSKLKIPALFDKYRIFAVARMDAAAFNYSPQGDIKQEVSQGKNLVWHWSIKPQEPAPQSLIISIRLTFEPKPGQDPRPDEDIWSNWYQVDVTEHVFESVFGKQASIFTSFTFITGGILSLFSVWDKIKPFKKQKAKEQSSV